MFGIGPVVREAACDDKSIAPSVEGGKGMWRRRGALPASGTIPNIRTTVKRPGPNYRCRPGASLPVLPVGSAGPSSWARGSRGGRGLVSWTRGDGTKSRLHAALGQPRRDGSMSSDNQDGTVAATKMRLSEAAVIWCRGARTGAWSCRFAPCAASSASPRAAITLGSSARLPPGPATPRSPSGVCQSY